MQKKTERIALITGAAGGIGARIASRLAEDGHYTILLDRSDAVIKTAAGLAARGLAVEHQVCDITNEAAVMALFRDLDKRLGGLDILVNNAGISPKHDGRSLTAENTPLDEWQAVIAVNLTAPFLLCRSAAPIMRRRGWGRIINIASLAGRTRSIVSGAHYSASKAGLIGFSRMFAGEVAGAGITVNCIAPGAIDAGLAQRLNSSLTDNYKSRIPVGRIGRPEEVAALASFIASDETGFITGATFDINGGYFMS
ncbi:SDR family oxidoreductase [Lacisediminimonas profundi]|uniref:SDR family oxidoreductase n=1 Tax=Lacisediminimonas profundi TaxID=2603856 RepID=UPI00124B20D2|nr:SDR family NAD(P)-dependent oxidoreductase [Lacisediminimonas profundi]